MEKGHMKLELGILLNQRYRILKILGRGGMRSIYHAVDENLGIDVAIKENHVLTKEAIKQFHREAIFLATSRHQSLPRVTDYFVSDTKRQYFIMDYIEGEDLLQRIAKNGAISESLAIIIGIAICDTLSYLHSGKTPILHRDIKPSNIKLTSDGQVFLVDFGLAKTINIDQSTAPGARAMTPGYSPPEQYGTTHTDIRSDIYSLAATLYAALTGVKPEDGLARAIDNTKLMPIRMRNPKVSWRTAATIERALATNPDYRYQTVNEFKESLISAQEFLSSTKGFSQYAKENLNRRELTAYVQQPIADENGKAVFKEHQFPSRKIGLITDWHIKLSDFISRHLTVYS